MSKQELYDKIMSNVSLLLKQKLNETKLFTTSDGYDVSDIEDETEDGQWEEFYDEDTDEVVKLWRSNKKNETTEKDINVNSNNIELDKEILEIEDEWSTLYDERLNIKYLLLKAQRTLQELHIDMEEVLSLCSSDEDRDIIGNEYAEKINEIEEEIEDCKETLSEYKSELNRLDKLKELLLAKKRF